MAGKMAVGTGYIPEFREPLRKEKRRADASLTGIVMVTALVLVVAGFYAARLISWVNAQNNYKTQLARYEQLCSEYNLLCVKLDSMTTDRYIEDKAKELGMHEPDPSLVKTVRKNK